MRRKKSYWTEHTWWQDALALLILFIPVLIFFFPLFYPTPHLFVTPDSYLSDILHFNLPLKKLLHDALSAHTLPFWTDLIGTGLPVIGEGQVQAFGLIHLVLYSILPLIPAYNLGYIIMFFMIGSGMYTLGRSLGWGRTVSVLVGFLCTFSGLHIVKIPHYNNLAALSYAPFIAALCITTWRNPRTRTILFLPFLIQQQLLQGHFQYIFMTYLTLGLYWYGFCFRNAQKRTDAYRVLLRIGSLVLLGIGMSMIQLLPSLEYFQHTLRGEGQQFANLTTSFGLSLSHLLSFIHPYILGDVRNATYQVSAYGVGFWETVSFFGTLPFLITFLSLFRMKTKPYLATLWVMILIMLCIALGQNSPFYFLLSIPPLSWFPGYSRFLFPITYLLLIIVGDQLETWWQNGRLSQILLLLLGIGSCIQLWIVAGGYNPILPASTIFTMPPIYKNREAGRIATIDGGNNWYTYMYTYGFQNPEAYAFLLNGGQPNYPLLFEIPNIKTYTGNIHARHSITNALTNSMREDPITHTASLTATALNTLRLHHTDTLISSYPLTNVELTEDQTIVPQDQTLTTFHRYHLPDTKPSFYISTRPKQTQTLEDYVTAVEDSDALHHYDAFLGTSLKEIPKEEQGEQTLTIVQDTPTQKRFHIDATSDVYLVASILLYPGWTATLDGQKTPLVSANVSGMAVLVPKGEHTVTLRFVPYSIYLGAFLSLGSMLLYGIVLIRASRRDDLSYVDIVPLGQK